MAGRVINQLEEERAAAGYGGELLFDEMDKLTRLDRLCLLVEKESASVLEVVTTVVYLWDKGYREPKLLEKLTDLKGHLSFNFEHAFELVHLYKLCPTDEPAMSH